MSRSFRFAAWVFIGTVVLQTAWILAVPPFRGIDEFDHVYRAASVADGHWLPSGERPDDGRGELVHVPPGIVRDAAPVCSALPYTGPDNCSPVDTIAPGVVSVASGAARYNPVFYFVIGSAAQPFDGAPAMYAMRIVNALLCSLLVAAAAWGTSLWARTRWPGIALLCVLTPVALYSTSVPGPNGVEMCGAAGLWAGLLGLGSVDPDARRRLLALATVCAVPLTLVRGLGPLWLTLIVLIAWLHLGPRRTSGLLREIPRTAWVCGAVVALTAVAAAGWTVGVESLAPEGGGYTDPVAGTFKQVPGWFFQSLAAFPMRNEPAPVVVYATAGIALGALLVVAIARADRHFRLVLLVAFGMALCIPVLLTLATYESQGPIWQGRYGWPASMGVLLCAGAALDRRPPEHRWVAPGISAGAVLFALAQVVSVTDVALDERHGVLAGDDRWWTVTPLLLAAMAVAGCACWAVGASRTDASLLSARITHSGQRADLLSSSDR